MITRAITIIVIAFIVSAVCVNAQTNFLDGRNMEQVYVDRSNEPYLTVTYELDLKSNITKDGITSAFVISTLSPKSVAPMMIAQGYEIKCEERLIRFATAASIKSENGKLVMEKAREMKDAVFVNPFTDRGMKAGERGALKAIITRSCSTEL
ncbi:MAG TPA: hypothetical protein VF721_19805 [Pyrinomonadaceae bacterium]|jgi:hypothetical protein